ncbi:type II toxin-antitoxin system RelE/ParE family toxin [Methylobacterium oryzisoli]|uniref:type II toxin-antitoxin system RelE/ParE family toxin n=1 Tax=Methylobacterium oryzisoli TaxID=3385502 RepID=UPI003891D6D4
MEIIEAVDARGHSPFARWFDRLDPQAAAKVTVALVRMAQGNLSSVKSVGGGVQECRIDFGREGETWIILLAGGTKKRQQDDIRAAKDLWEEYKRRRKEAL